jgi:hypothetical protein
LPVPPWLDYNPAMDTVPVDPEPVNRGVIPPNETEAARAIRLAWEAERIAEADASIAAGLSIDEADVDAWLDSLGTSHELPRPIPRR